MASEIGWMKLLKTVANRGQSCIPVDRTIEDAVKHMSSAETGVVVFIEDDRPVGIMTERDVVTVLHHGISLDTPLRTLKRAPLTVNEDKTLLFGLNMLIVNNIRRIIVVDRGGKYVGVVTQDDLIHHLEEELYRREARIVDVISTRQVLRSVTAGDSLRNAVSIMADHTIGSVLVMEKGVVAGILTERDMLRVAAGGGGLSMPAGAVMSRPVVTAAIDAPVNEVLNSMKARNIHRILIVYPDGSPFRLLTNRDILRSLESGYLEFLNSKIKHAREVLDFLPEIILEVIDVAGEQVIQWCSRKTREVFGGDRANHPVTSLIPPDAWNTLYPKIVAEGRIEKAVIEIGERTFELSASYMKMQHEGIIQAILLDVTSEVVKSSRDYLTGAYNRRKFDEILTREIERAKRYGHSLSMAMADIDHFKNVNDGAGHKAGDLVLQELTRLITRNIREVDVLARYGGEEFAILSPDTDLNGMVWTAEKLRRLIETWAFPGGHAITVSFGAAQLRPGEEKTMFIERADTALYRAKANGRNRVEREA